MITILGSLLGLVSAFAPRILEWMQAKDDNRHELAMLQASGQIQLQAIEAQALANAATARYKHDQSALAKAGSFFSGLSASVRPVTTYLFVLLFIFTKGTVVVIATAEAYLIFDLVRESYNLLTALGEGYKHFAQRLALVWDEPTMGVFSAIIAFWFGQRAFLRGRGA